MKAIVRTRVERPMTRKLLNTFSHIAWTGSSCGLYAHCDPTLLSAFPNRVVNIHPALLPSFKGLHAQQQALDAGVSITGATVHLVTPEMDDGPTIARAPFSI